MTNVPGEVAGILEFLRSAERLKNVHRSAWTSTGAPESVAEHTWRLCLMVVVLADEFGPLNVGRLLKMCIVHDLGEAIGGDVPAVKQDPAAPKSANERRDLLTLLEPLPAKSRDEIVALWDEYEAAASAEAKIAKALDKLETIMQHNQGSNPADFDYRFNLTYGARFTADHPLVVQIRAVLDAETEQRARQTETAN
jgi:putative hydrolase of HD superfamily